MAQWLKTTWKKITNGFLPSYMRASKWWYYFIYGWTIPIKSAFKAFSMKSRIILFRSLSYLINLFFAWFPSSLLHHQTHLLFLHVRERWQILGWTETTMSIHPRLSRCLPHLVSFPPLLSSFSFFFSFFQVCWALWHFLFLIAGGRQESQANNTHHYLRE